MSMEDLRSWLKKIAGLGQLKVVEGADPHLELGFFYPKSAKISFGSRAVIDACRPFDWINEFPRVVQSSDEERDKVLKKWKGLFD